MKTKKYLAPAINIEEAWPILLETASITSIGGNSGLGKGSDETPTPGSADSRAWDWDDDDDF